MNLDSAQNDGLEKLKQIGVKKINQDTKISIGVLQNIIHKRFDAIQRVWVVGFLPILEREYDIDLSFWLQEYDEYHLTHQEDSRCSYQIGELELDTQRRAASFTNKFFFKRFFSLFNLSVFLYLILGVVVVGVVVVLYHFFSDSKPYDVGYVVVDPKSEIKSDGVKEDQGVESFLNSSLNPPTDTSQKDDLDLSSSLLEPKEGELMIIPREDLWFQTIDPKTQRKEAKIISDSTIMKIPQDGVLFLFGHGGFSIAYRNSSQRYSRSRPMYFVVQNRVLKSISYAEFQNRQGGSARRDFQGTADSEVDESLRESSNIKPKEEAPSLRSSSQSNSSVNSSKDSLQEDSSKPSSSPQTPSSVDTSSKTSEDKGYKSEEELDFGSDVTPGD